VYFGGAWTDWNDAGAGGDNVIRFDPSDQSWNILVGASEVGAAVYGIIEGPNGTIYLCGGFANVGDAAGDGIVSYDPTADTWTSLGAPAIDVGGTERMRDMAFDSSGNLYVVGLFADVAGVANTGYIAKWNGTAWAAVGGVPAVGAGYPSNIVIDSQDNIIISGSFTNFAGVAAADYLARWNGTAWADLGSGTQSGNVVALAITGNDTLYLGGSFTDQGGNTDCDYVCSWDGRQFSPMLGGGTPAATINDLALALDGRLFASGWALGNSEIISWNGSAWEIWDTDLNAYRITIGPADSVIPTNYDIWIGDDASASREIGGTATVTNDGTAPAHPILKVYRSGGAGASLYTLRNETTGKMLMFDYDLLDGETLTVDCRPDQQRITSSFFGARPDAILANSDFGTFALKSGANQITCFVDEDTAPTVTAWLEWKAIYKGAD